MITVLIVDGEPLARAHIARMLEARPGFQVVGKLCSAAEAVDAIRRLRPNIVFLDQDLTDSVSFDPRVLREGDPAAVLILTTAQENPTPRLLHLHALDSLLKPFDGQRFDRVVGRAGAYLGLGDRLTCRHLRLLAAYPQESEEGASFRGVNASRRYADRLLVRDGDRISFLKVDDIDRIEAGAGIARVHAGGRVHFLAESLDDLARRLDPRQFLSVRRSLLVNLDRLEPLEAVR
ncbi:MAG: LytR/AlgR family response regulator transcription factor [Gemmatimonadota bacterium]